MMSQVGVCLPTPLLFPCVGDQEVPPRSSIPPSLHRASYERYTQPDAPFELASSGDVQLISFLWLQKRAKEGKELPRRQDLPPEAVADMDALRKAHGDLPPHIRAAVLPMLSVSYCWLEPGHPDPDGKQLRHVVETLDKYLFTVKSRNAPEKEPEPWHSFFPDMAVFWDWGASARVPPLFPQSSANPPPSSPQARSTKRTQSSSTLAAGDLDTSPPRGGAMRSELQRRRTRRAGQWRRRSPFREPCTTRWTSGAQQRPPFDNLYFLPLYSRLSPPQVCAPDDHHHLCDAHPGGQ